MAKDQTICANWRAIQSANQGSIKTRIKGTMAIDGEQIRIQNETALVIHFYYSPPFFSPQLTHQRIMIR